MRFLSKLGEGLASLPVPLLLVLIYASWIAVGAGLLLLPPMTTAPITVSDALFTATSAVTVTGLVVVDTGEAFTRLGQGIILLLIQLGGMGLMTFALVMLNSLGLSVGLQQRTVLREEMGINSLNGVVSVARRVFLIVLICEAVGAALLAFMFVPRLGWEDGLWQALFHSVSAFNNAGFSTWSDSLMGWTGVPGVLAVIALLFIIGGLGFSVLSDMLTHRRWGLFTLHSKLMLVGTVGLILVGILGFAALEWSNPETLGGLPPGERLAAAAFEGVTPRTAGFNSLDTGAQRDATALLTMTLMVIGGGSTSTAGGIKVTTFVALILATLAFFRQSGQVNAFGAAIGFTQALKVMALLTVSLLVILTGLFIILATHELNFLDAAFEVTSAFGTVGLSRGITGELDDTGRAVLCVIMYLGRLGPLTLGFLLATKTKPRLRYPEGEVYLG